MENQPQYLDFIQEQIIPNLKEAELIQRRTERILRIGKKIFLLSFLAIVFLFLSWGISELGQYLIGPAFPGKEAVAVFFTVLLFGGFTIGILSVFLAIFVMKPRFEKALDDAGVTQKILELLAPELSCQLEQFIPLTTAQESGLFVEHEDWGRLKSYRGRCFLSGVAGNTPFGLSEIAISSWFWVEVSRRKFGLVEREIDRQRVKAPSRRLKIESHRGLFMVVDRIAPIQGSHIIVHAGEGSNISAFESKLVEGGKGAAYPHGELGELPLTTTGDPAFDDRFKIYSTNGREVRDFLSPVLKNRLVALVDFASNNRWPLASGIKSATPGDLRIALTRGKFYLYLNTGALFLPSFYKDLTSVETFQWFPEDLAMILGLAEDLGSFGDNP